MNTAFQGLGVFSAHPIAVGQAYILNYEPVYIPDLLPNQDIEAELRRLDHALDQARRHLERVKKHIPDQTSTHIADFIDAHLLMLTDSSLVDATRELIRERGINASWALQIQRDTLMQVFEDMDDPYFYARKEDIKHVVHHIQIFLYGAPSLQDPLTLNQNDLKNKVVISKDLTPAEAIILRQQGISSFVTEQGSPMSHTAILARSLDIPTVLGVAHVTTYIRPGEMLVVNAETGTVLATNDNTTLIYYQQRQAGIAARHLALKSLLHQPSQSRDGIAVSLFANLELPEDVILARANGAQGIGLYRTEFLYLNQTTLPDEEAHFENYRTIIEGLDGIPLTIRTFDLGLDKQIENIQQSATTTNSALGLRAIRLCLRQPELFLPQLRAILRASALGPIRLMVPMISTMDEIKTVLQLIHELKQRLHREGLAFDPQIPIGGMIEVPAAVLIAKGLAEHLDFFSIGTNDLIQYTLAIDRLNDAVNYLYNPLHPAVLRLIYMTIQTATTAGIRVSMCGEMAGDARYTPVLLGLGLREFSMQPGALLHIKDIIRHCHIHQLERTMTQLLPQLETLSSEQLLEQLTFDR
jgi:phosphotransferase system enzyme I (PtsI)